MADKIGDMVEEVRYHGFDCYRLRVQVTFSDEALGMSPTGKEIYRDFIASKAPDAQTKEEEVAAYGVDDVVNQGMTRFPRNSDGDPVLLDYQLKGFFKDSCGLLRRVDGTKSKKMTTYKKVIDGNIFVEPREIALHLPEGAEIGVCERPLRTNGPTGERVALASSETVPAGTTMDFEVYCMRKADVPLVVEWLDYGAIHGLCQWRNSGKGRFEWSARKGDAAA